MGKIRTAVSITAIFLTVVAVSLDSIDQLERGNALIQKRNNAQRLKDFGVSIDQGLTPTEVENITNIVLDKGDCSGFSNQEPKKLQTLCDQAKNNFYDVGPQAEPTAEIKTAEAEITSEKIIDQPSP